MKKLVISKDEKTGKIVQKHVNLDSDQQKNVEAEWNANLKEKAKKQYISKRNNERGTVEKQLEFIVENGLDAFIQRDMNIRAKHPKPEDE